MYKCVESKGADEMKKALFFLFDGFAEFEVNLASLFLKSKGFEIVTASVDNATVTGEGGFQCKPHISIDGIIAKEYEILIVPGGEIFHHLENPKLLSLAREINEQNKWLAAICAGTALLQAADVLQNKRFSTSLTPEVESLAHLHEWKYKQSTDVTVDGKIITAVGSAYVEFAAEIIKQLNLFDEGEEKETLLYFKNIKELSNKTLA
ncbi:glutamine amidotransferase [Bacillus pseudomycoides]|nr:DJ-1/PfpI family protein [Bacillus sp. 95MFCvi2.1]PEB41125.1 glutamine amidotransferase [Bacillus pseudomycoides]PGD93904.1 glutamine amidotransferase [Bacillus pseudomycoides]PGE01120.1 glutamine amidotransferase [Bacillus pseudomycoides]PGE96769.1 glutamine amidotransferase [Bacillus pseudomycoides]PHB30120.1 glutamine amidotransferase [Bacillus pseudomycoides]